MRRQNKEFFKTDIMNFYICSIIKEGAFDYWLDDELFEAASRTFNISYRTARRYFFQLVPEDFYKKYEY